MVAVSDRHNITEQAEHPAATRTSMTPPRNPSGGRKGRVIKCDAIDKTSVPEGLRPVQRMVIGNEYIYVSRKKEWAASATLLAVHPKGWFDVALKSLTPHAKVVRARATDLFLPPLQRVEDLEGMM